MENQDCFFYVAGDRSCPTFCCYPSNKELDYPPCDDCQFYIKNRRVYDLVVDYVTPKAFGTIEPEKIKADNKGEHIITLATRGLNKMIYVGFSQHDDEAWYKCPVCNQQYGSWGFINGSVKVYSDGTFKCKCGTILVKPK